MKRRLHIIFYTFIVIFALAGIFTSLFWKTIHEYWAVYQYAKTFKPDVIDQNFRSLYKTYSSIRVPHTDNVSALPVVDKPLPATYVYKDQTREVADFLKKTDTTGFIVLKDGMIIHEEYARGNTEQTQSIAMSLSKSFISFLIGNAVDDGLISLDETVDHYAPVLKDGGYKGVTVKNVLQMSSGIGFNEDYGDLNSDIVRYIIQILTGSVIDFTAHLKSQRPQGTVNEYVSADTQVLGMVLEGATGVPLQKYFQDRLWSKLGAEADAYWLTDSTGEVVAAGGLNAVLRDFARFGLLYMNGGRSYRGEQIVPAKWVHDSVTPDAPHLMPGRPLPDGKVSYGYGYQWWIPAEPQGDFVGVGIYGQFIYVNPAKRVVIVKTSAYSNFNVDGAAMKDETIHMFQSIASQLE
ncbi:serine hydrolase [Ochrobactrum sp. Marseille-Q0166]|uniref:serine hydrolase domain-containing protein n=1 Tax=Ochrobactrum sp. Marseille-Q0166 TaxID=2761105 RepID=UPI0016561DB9|nr:serine hydrolase [Ochrobactrum sp. Marseille-Q0166]MBC8716852.1 serine hydrolase [Ochrobactrum sp. Marseille-Q0166]